MNNIKIDCHIQPIKQNNNILMDKKVNVTNGNSAWEDFKSWHKKFSDSKAEKYRQVSREYLEMLQKELEIIKQ